MVESEDAVRERGTRGASFRYLLSSETANSAFHGTRRDVSHICDVMDRLVTGAERRFGINRYSMAPQMAFISHETYNARTRRRQRCGGGLCAAQHLWCGGRRDCRSAIPRALPVTRWAPASRTSSPSRFSNMALCRPYPNYKEVDPDLGTLNLSRGGRYPVQYALHLAAGFGSQISMTLLRRVPGGHDRVDNKGLYRRWLSDVSGNDMAETEVVKRVLRVVATGAPGRRPAASTWKYGTGPVVRSTAPGSGVMTEYRPLPMPAVTRATAPTGPAAPAPTAPAPVPPAAVAPVCGARYPRCVGTGA